MLSKPFIVVAWLPEPFRSEFGALESGHERLRHGRGAFEVRDVFEFGRLIIESSFRMPTIAIGNMRRLRSLRLRIALQSPEMIGAIPRAIAVRGVGHGAGKRATIAMVIPVALAINFFNADSLQVCELNTAFIALDIVDRYQLAFGAISHWITFLTPAQSSRTAFITA